MLLARCRSIAAGYMAGRAGSVGGKIGQRGPRGTRCRYRSCVWAVVLCVWLARASAAEPLIATIPAQGCAGAFPYRGEVYEGRCAVVTGIQSAGECTDSVSECVGWANRGECVTNPHYMRLHCCQSCEGFSWCVTDDALIATANASAAEWPPGRLVKRCAGRLVTPRMIYTCSAIPQGVV